MYKRRLNNAERAGVQLPKSSRRKDKLPVVTIRPPAVFSIIENPEQTLAFLEELGQTLRTRHVFVDISGVTGLTPEAVAAFVAIFMSSKLHNMRIAGNHPKSEVLADKLRAFGFYDHVRSSKSTPFGTGNIRITNYRSLVRFKREVNTEIAAEMVDFARSTFPTGLHKSVYTMFMEATTNTVEHASNSNLPTLWVAGAYHDADRKVISFTVIDSGVGILNSVKFNRDLRSLWGRVSWDSGEKLRQLCLGKMRSRMQEVHRGRGLPGAYEAAQAARIADLVIITNRGFAHVKLGKYLETKQAFNGTIIYWEVGPSTP
jgi:anti-sigma regulatory factor (Ser/Thr protein kinase)